MAARSFSHPISAHHGRWLGRALCVHELRGQVGTGRGKYRLRMDADFRSGAADEEIDRTPLQRKCRKKLKQQTLSGDSERVRKFVSPGCQARTTLPAWNPLGPFSRSNSTVSPSFSVRYPFSW